MTREERLKLIKRRARPVSIVTPAKPKGMRLAGDPEAVPAHRMKRARELTKSPPKWRSSVFGLDLRMSQTGAEWTKVPDEKPEPGCEIKRRRGQHYLEVIAEKVPGKLPKLI